MDCKAEWIAVFGADSYQTLEDDEAIEFELAAKAERDYEHYLETRYAD